MRLYASLTLLLLCAVSACAGQIQGRVTNAQGTAVSGAKVTVATPQGESRGQATTAADGSYTVPGLEPGSYIISVSAAALTGTLQRQVKIGEGAEPVQADFQFQAAASASIAAEERNPNIFVYRIDLNDLRNRLTVGRGADPTYVQQFASDQNYFGAEFGAPLLSYEILRPRTLLEQWRGSLYGLHQNSALNARNFFNVGPLLASRATSYSITANGPLVSDRASLLLQYGDSLTSGAVNGNIQSPDLGTDRIPTSPDPQKRAIIASLLRAYPLEEPNLGTHRLNSNAPRDITAKDALARLDYRWNDKNSVALRYTISDYSEDPFQIAAGQNPQTDVRTQAAYLSLTRTISPRTTARLAFNFDRTGAALLPTKRFSDLYSSLGIIAVPEIDFSSDEFTDLGPGTQFPRKRAQNRFQLYGDVTHAAGRHTFKAGWSTTRVRLNDLQSDNARGIFKFSSENIPLPGCPTGKENLEVLNFLAGCPSTFTIAVGNFYRGFRNWEHFGYFEDQVRLRPTFTTTAGIRYELQTAPTEVNHLTDVGFHTDKNNFAPRFGFAWNPRRGKTTIRGAYGISYSMILPVTYGMTRFNLPEIQVIQVSAPDLLNPLAGFSSQPTPGTRSTTFHLSPDLVSAYSHQYSFGIERAMRWNTTLRVGYFGSRTFHLLTEQVSNRALPSATLPNTTATINQRRPDPQYFDEIVVESNANSYYDALQVTADKRLSRGLTFRASYTFSKNIDTGGDFTNTATGVEKPPETGTPACWLCDHVSDHKGWSLFDTPQQFALIYSYSLPFAARSNGWARALLAGWQVSGTTIFQSGTPYHLHTGGDGPGLGNVDGWSQDRPNITNPALLGMSFDNPDTSVQLMGANTCRKLTASEVPAGVAPYVQCSYFDTNIPVGGRGNTGMNVFRKDGTANWNFALGRTFRLPGGQERSLQFRSEFINLFNTAQFDKASVQLSSAIFGQITNTANKGRQVQFSLRLNF